VRISRGVRTPEGADGDAWQAVQERAHDARARRRQRPAPILFGLRLFKNVELTFLVRNLKISKNGSCRATIGLQLLQRATYVLINGLSGNVGRNWQNSRPQVTVHSAFNSIFDQFALKIGMSANYEKCFPGNNEQLSYWPILNFYSEIWRTRKKTESAFLRSRVLTTIWDFDQGLLCKCVPNHVKHV
jgi:hypothetical protein